MSASLSPYIIQHLMDQTQTGPPDPQPAHKPNQTISPCPTSPDITSSLNSTLPHSPPSPSQSNHTNLTQIEKWSWMMNIML